MPKGYWIVHVSVDDPVAYEGYRAAVMDALAPFGGRFLVRGGAQEIHEGDARARTVVVEFPSLGDAKACYESAGYASLKAMRQAAANTDLVIVEGFNG